MWSFGTDLTDRQINMNLNFNLEDASQVAIGAFALAVPISFSEEA